MTSEVLTLVLVGSPRALDVRELEGAPSRLTGRDRRRVEAEFVIGSEQANNDLVREIGAARHREGAITEDGSERKWLTEDHSWSHSGQSPFHHRLVLAELEDPLATEIRIGDLVITPEKYEENAEGDGPYTVTFIATVEGTDEDALERFLAENRQRGQLSYFPVVRVGVRDEPVRMRFGRCLWQSLDAGRRHLITLVSEEDDSESVLQAARAVEMIHEPDMQRLKGIAVGLDAQVQALLTELEEWGLPRAAVDRVRLAGRPESISQETAARQFERADDVESFWL